MVDAPDAGALRSYVEEEEAVEDRRLTEDAGRLIDRENGERSLTQEVRRRHLPASKERCSAGEEPDHDQAAADRLDDAGRPKQRSDVHRSARPCPRRPIE